MTGGASVAIFVSQVVTLLVCGRLVGELLQRLGQPLVMGQLIAGVLLGPSVLGALAPGLSHALFPADPAQKAMLEAMSQLGILLLLLMTGLETDLAVFRDARRTALSISLSGIVVPFACGMLLGALLPERLLPDPNRRLITALFLGTALSISSVKIVALVVRDLGFLRRTVGQVIVAAAVIDDTIGWIIMSVTLGLAAQGRIDLFVVSRSVLGTALFLVLAFTVGRRLVFRLVRWSNDYFVSEMPVVATILAITLVMALLTEAIGVHLVLGAFVAGILVGQSPMVTKRITEQLRGLIVGLFMPLFFALAGLTTDFSALAQTDQLVLTGVLILLASVCKFSGAFLGGRIGGLSYAESFAVGSGMNARGSTEVVVASIGLSMGVLNRNLFTAIVAMAIVTTMSMPSMLRWTLRRLPLTSGEKTRLEREEFESQGFVKHIERLLAGVDDSPSGQLAARLIGLIAGVRGIPTTVLHFDADSPSPSATDADRSAAENHVEQAAAAVQAAAEAGDEAANQPESAEITTRFKAMNSFERAIQEESRKGYGLLVIGRESGTSGEGFDAQITRIVKNFQGAFAITVARRERASANPTAALDILVPITGTGVARDGAELAIALAQATQGTVTALYVSSPQKREPVWSLRFGSVLVPRDSAEAAIREIVKLGELYGIAVRGVVRTHRSAETVIMRELEARAHSLLVMGVSPRPGEQLFFGDVAAAVLERAPCSMLFVSGERR